MLPEPFSIKINIEFFFTGLCVQPFIPPSVPLHQWMSMIIFFFIHLIKTLLQSCLLIPQSGKSCSTLSAETSRNLLVCFLWIMKNAEQSLIQRWIVDISPSQLSRLLELLTICTSCFDYRVRAFYLGF